MTDDHTQTGDHTQDDHLEVRGDDLSEAQYEMFEKAFLAKEGIVEWRGARYRVAAMDQNYPENSDDIRVSFSLRKVAE